MSYWVAGDTVSESFILDSMATGQTFTRAASYVNNSAVTFNPTFTEVGSGAYRFSYATTTGSTAGAYEWIGTTSTSGETVTINFDLNTSAVSVTVSAATSGALTQTLAQLRNRVADRLGDRVELTATSNGATNTFIDALNVNTATEDMKGRIMVLADSGEVVRVTAMNDSTNTLTFTPAAASSASTNTGSVANVFNKRGKGFRPDEYKNAINNAINDAYPLGLIAVQAAIVAAFDYDTQSIAVPAALTHVHTLEYADTDGLYHILPRGSRRNEYGWFADRANGLLYLTGYPGQSVDGLTLRVAGFGRQDTLSADSDTCALNAEWIIARACYHLCLSGVDKDERYGSMVMVFERETQQTRSRLRTLDRRGAVEIRAA